MGASEQSGASRLQMPLYRPGRGLRSTRQVVAKTNQRSCSIQQKVKRPDIQIYVPKVNLFASKVSERSCSPLSDGLPEPEKDKINVPLPKASPSCANTGSFDVQHIDEPEVKIINHVKEEVKSSNEVLNSWADQVEASSQSSEELCYLDWVTKAMEQENGSILIADCQDVTCLPDSDPQATIVRDNKSDLSHFVPEKEPSNTKSSQADVNQPLSRDEIIDLQVAFFDKLIVHGKSSKRKIIQKMVIPKSSASPVDDKSPASTSCTPIAWNALPGIQIPNVSEKLIAQDSVAMPKLNQYPPVHSRVINPPVVVSPSYLPHAPGYIVSPKPKVPEKLHMPNSFAVPELNQYPLILPPKPNFSKKFMPKYSMPQVRYDPATNLKPVFAAVDHAPYVPGYLNSGDYCPNVLDHEYFPAATMPFYPVFTRLDHTLCSPHCLVSGGYNSNFLSDYFYIQPPQPLVRNV